MGISSSMILTAAAKKVSAHRFSFKRKISIKGSMAEKMKKYRRSKRKTRASRKK